MPSPLQSLMSMEPPKDAPMDEPQEPQSTDSAVDRASRQSTESCITAPKGLKTPEGHADGGTFQGTFRGRIENGKLYFDSINNIPTHSEEGESDEEEAAETPEEEAKEPDEADKAWAKTKSENDAFKKAFHG